MKKTYMMWAGTEEAFHLYCEAVRKFSLMTPQAAGVVLEKGAQKPDDTPLSRLLDVQDGIGMISVHGVLTSQDNWWNEYAGLVSYNEIRQAALEAMARDDVHEVLLDIASPGGSVAGVKDAVDTLGLLSSQKPLTAFTDSQATSAGYWIASPAKHRYLSGVALVGSIGVIFKHFEYSKAMEEEGVTATVIRSGEYKALANDVEPLSAKAQRELQDKSDHIYKVFVDSVAENLGLSAKLVESTMANGKEFIGSQAVDVGLFDAVSNFDKVYATIAQRVAKNNAGGQDMKKKYTMSAAMAAVAAGVPVAPEDVTPEAAAAPEAPAAVAPEAEVAAEAAAPEAEATVPEDGAMQLLKSQLKEANDTLVDLKVEAGTLKKTHEAMAAAVEPLKAIVAQTINNMAVALGGVADDTLKTLEPAALASRHDAVVKQFTEAFKVGGVAAVDGSTEEEAETPRLSALEQRRLKVVKIGAAGR